MARCIKILALKITRLLPKPLKTWAISFVLPCAQAGTCVRPIRRTQPLLPARPWGRARWCFQAETNLLPFDTNSNLA